MTVRGRSIVPAQPRSAFALAVKSSGPGGRESGLTSPTFLSRRVGIPVGIAPLQITLLAKRRCGINRVQGFGGFFFRANDPEKLANWYRDHLGVNPAPQDMEMAPWVTDSGVTVFAPFAADTDYFGADKTFMLNFRVADLAAMVAQLASAGIEVSHESEMAGIGRFARIHDPEGNPIELWEPES